MIAMWPDNETSVDLLGFDVHRDLLAGLVTNRNLLPVTVGLFGDWGGGKSSVMRMLKDRLDAQEGVACLYFNGWTFEGYDDAKSALITSILIQLGEHKRFGPKLRGRVASMLKRVNYMRMAAVILKQAPHAASAAAGLAVATGFVDAHTAAAAVATVAGVGGAVRGAAEASGVDDQGGGDEGEVDWASLIQKDQTQPAPLDIRTFRRDFERLLAESELKAIVVLIDDLDRCSPERLIENLEAIKLFLAVPGTAFVIGADERIVRHAVATRYAAQHSESLDLVTDYVEKLVQVPYHLPRLSASEIETYITLLFCELYLPSKADFERVRTDCAEKRRRNPRQTYGMGAVTELLSQGMPEALGRSLQWASVIAPTLSEGLKGNPRQVKRMLNALLLRRSVAEVAGLTVRDEVLVKLMLLEYSRPALFEQLYVWQATSEGRSAQLAALEKASRDDDKVPDELAAWDEPWVRRWLSLDPTLADVDLSDYFWVARDRIRAELAGIAAVSPVVRRLFESIVAANDVAWRLSIQEVSNLERDDQAALLNLLASSVIRHPEQDAAIRSLTHLAGERIPGAGSALIQTMRAAPAATLHASAPRRIEAAIGADPSLQVGLKPILESWATSQSPVGRAASQVLRRMNQPSRRS
jgi:hypothetical protein